MTNAPVLSPRDAYALWATTYAATAHTPIMRAEETAMLPLVRPRLGGAVVLDAGCGTGRYLRHALAGGAAPRLIGVDLSHEMLTCARGDGYELVEGELARLPVRDRHADLIVSGLAVGHEPDLQAVVSEFARVLTPRGEVIVSDMHPAGAAAGWQRTFAAAGRVCAAAHTIHTLEAWHSAATGAGLRVAEVVEAGLTAADAAAHPGVAERLGATPVVLVLRLERGAMNPS